jgi:GNAT superfamily N-acetyltransferase
MSMVREAAIKDLDQLIEMGMSFIAYSGYSEYADPDPDVLKDVLCNLMKGGKVFVAEYKGEIIGGIAGLTSPLWFSPQVLFAVEIAWWVREDHRGGTAGIKLLRAFEGWAKSIGCKAVCLSDLIINNTSPAGALFGKLGYSVLERSHIKGI